MTRTSNRVQTEQHELAPSPKQKDSRHALKGLYGLRLILQPIPQNEGQAAGPSKQQEGFLADKFTVHSTKPGSIVVLAWWSPCSLMCPYFVMHGKLQEFCNLLALRLVLVLQLLQLSLSRAW